MVTIQYPNRDALQQGLNIYRVEMSAFIARCLRQKQGSTLVASVSRSLTDRQAQDFEDSLRESDGKVEAAIEIGFVPRDRRAELGRDVSTGASRFQDD